MIEVRQTAEFLDWLVDLRDVVGRARIDRGAQGNFGDHKSVGDGVSELRFYFGPRYGCTKPSAMASWSSCSVVARILKSAKQMAKAIE